MQRPSLRITMRGTPAQIVVSRRVWYNDDKLQTSRRRAEREGHRMGNEENTETIPGRTTLMVQRLSNGGSIAVAVLPDNSEPEREVVWFQQLSPGVTETDNLFITVEKMDELALAWLQHRLGPAQEI